MNILADTRKLVLAVTTSAIIVAGLGVSVGSAEHSLSAANGVVVQNWGWE